MNRDQKARVVADLKEYFSAANATFLVDYKGISVEQMRDLKRSLRGVDGSIKVAKRRLMGIAASQMDLDAWGDLPWVGQLGLVFAKGEVPAVAKVLVDFAKKNNAVEIKAGFFESKAMGSDGVNTLASLPSREVLLGMLAGVLNAPIAGLARALNEVPGGLARSLRAAADKKE